MNSGDILSFAAAIGIVLIMVCIVHPPWAAPGAAPAAGEAVLTPMTTLPVTAPATPAPIKTFVPVRIEYAHQPVIKYQTYIIPDNLTTFGMSDPPWRGTNISSFAYLEGSYGGVTDPFSVSYPVWRLNCTVSKGEQPENARFKMMLIEKETGIIIDGAELKGPGKVIKNQEISGKEFYLVIQSSYAAFRVDLETREEYLDSYPGVVVKKA
ncbi:MAG: hypothetical protein PHU26_03075 [Methanofollis liminatans]|jgi:hypothetical protein|nr:hypothetical protein [Methanofollis liminatans]